MKEIDITNWNRKEHYEFFSNFASPQLGVTTELDCTKTYLESKKNNISFFAKYLHKSMIAANSVQEFKLRIIDGRVFELDLIHAGTTIGRSDGTFAFAFVDFDYSFNQFNDNLQKEIKDVTNSSGLRLFTDDKRYDLVRHTSIPWFSISTILHPTKLDKTDSIPKITFSKIKFIDGKYFLPVSVECHHGLVDGYHLSLYFKAFQDELNRE